MARVDLHIIPTGFVVNAPNDHIILFSNGTAGRF